MTYGLNDGFVAYLQSLGFSGTVGDMERAWLLQLTSSAYPDATVQDLRRIVCDNVGITGGTVQEDWLRFYETVMINNFESLNDGELAFYNYKLSYTPRDIFDDLGLQVAWYDISAIGTLYQDSAGTIPATIGSPVGRVLDRGNSGAHLLQPTSSKRPVLVRDSSGYLYLQFDGVDDFLYSEATIDLSAVQKLTACLGSKRDNTSTTHALFEHGRVGTDGQAVYLTSVPGNTNYSQQMQQAGVAAVNASPIPGLAVTSHLYNRTQSTLANQLTNRYNGTVPGNNRSGTAVTAGSYFGDYVLYMGARQGTSNFLTGRIYNLVLAQDVLTGTNLSDLETYVNSKTGAY